MRNNDFESIIFPLVNKIYRLSKRLLISHEEAQDATQEVLIKAYTVENQNIKNIESYILRITKNYCLDVLKSKRVQNRSRLENEDFVDFNLLSDAIESKNELKIIEKIIEQLPDTQKIIVQLREIEQKEYGEIAAILEINETAVRMQNSRARKMIQKTFEKINNHGTK